MKDLTNLLFETNAFNIAKENKPFWYTSGKIGPYFVNGEFFYGSDADSKELLAFIDSELENETKENIPAHIFEKVLAHYNSNEIYKTTIDAMVEYIKESVDIAKIDYISGGERRDWFFSNMIAYILEKPHVTIYKDLSTVVSDYKFTENAPVEKIEGKKFLHVADLLNQSASFTRAWIPAIENLGSKILWSIFVIDRMDGGTQVLTDCGVEVLSLLKINDELFVKALELGIINNKQLQMLRDFKKDQMGSMRQFLIEHPEFLEESLNSDNSKTAKRAKLLVEQDLYGLNK